MVMPRPAAPGQASPVIRRVAVAGHFGEWMQGRLGPDGPVVLITLPSEATGVQCWHRPGLRGLHLHGAGLTLPRARAFLSALGAADMRVDTRVDTGGRARLAGRVHLRPRHAPGLGTGVSTAALLALARLAGWNGSWTGLAQVCVQAEGASDPLMFPAPEQWLWASRIGRQIHRVPPVPRHEIIGGFLGPARRTEPRDTRFPDIADLVARWQRAHGLPEFAALAAESAARCLLLRGPADDPMARLARHLGALGWVMAHTGAARGLVFAPGTVPRQARAALHEAGLRDLVQFTGGR